MTPIFLVKEYAPERVVHVAAIDPLSGKSLVIQTALLMGQEAELIGTMRQPDTEPSIGTQFWTRVQEELKSRSIRRVVGAVPRHLFEHYQRDYGMTELGSVQDPLLGRLVLAGKILEPSASWLDDATSI